MYALALLPNLAIPIWAPTARYLYSLSRPSRYYALWRPGPSFASASMSPAELATLDGIPALAPAQAHLRRSYATIELVKIFKRRCSEVLEQCASLLIALRGNVGEETSKELATMAERLDAKMSALAALGPLQSFLRRQEINQEIHRLFRDLNALGRKLHVNTLQAHSEGSKGTLERDNADIRALLQVVVSSTTEMQALLSMDSERPVYGVMEALQTELYDAHLAEPLRTSFAHALWFLHEQTNKLPPLTDLTGQVTLDGTNKGEWLGREKVVLRSPRSLPHTAEVRERYEREVENWRHLKHENIISLYGIIYSGQELFIVQPWMDNGTALDFIEKNPDVDRLEILSEVASGLEFLHKEQIVHGDLRGANVLIDPNGSALLSGFGTVSFIENCGDGTTSFDTVNARWSAPELLRNNGPVSIQSDPPYNNIPRDITVLRELDQGKIPERPGHNATTSGLSDDLWALMRKCWRKPESRPSAASVKSRLLRLRGLGGSSPKRPSFFLNRPSTADGPRPKPSGGQMHLRVPSMPSGSSTSSLHASLAMTARPRRPSSAGSATYFEGEIFHSPPSSYGSVGKFYSSSDDLSTTTLYPDTDSDMQSARSGSSQYSLPDSLILLDVTPAGDVVAGNLEGLVDRLLAPDGPKHSEFQEVLLSTYHDFTTAEILLAIVIRRFRDSGSNPKNSEVIQSNIFAVLTFWVSNTRLQVCPQLLSDMKHFSLSVMTEKTSMNEKARNLLHLTEERATIDKPVSPITPPSTKIPRTADILPRDLAIALTLLEGDKYRSILPADYLSHLRKLDGSNNVDAARLANNRVVLWVKKSVLTPSRVETRAEVFKFFVNTAHECRKLRNFASLSAIANALQSTAIERLTLTVGALSPHLRDMLQDLKNLLDPSNNHITYRASLRPEEALDPQYRDFAIPWLAVHLRDLNSLLQNYPPHVEVDGRPLINFRRYTRFMEHLRGLRLFKPPDLERYRQNGQLAYLQHQLRGMHIDPDADVALMQRSLELEADEIRIHRTRALELKRLGFRSSS
ncbi:ras guanine nucleotide exchange factor domain-containing protein [Mycena galericulata]|nr:ras guanine nucleotide exchange factor domain-containing protein [Mycena galericulata]